MLENANFPNISIKFFFVLFGVLIQISFKVCFPRVVKMTTRKPGGSPGAERRRRLCGASSNIVSPRLRLEQNKGAETQRPCFNIYIVVAAEYANLIYSRRGSSDSPGDTRSIQPAVDNRFHCRSGSTVFTVCTTHSCRSTSTLHYIYIYI